MTEQISGFQKPDIIISETDYDRLAELADAAGARLPAVAGALLAELDRADIRPAGQVPPRVVRMGGTVEYVSGGETWRVTLVWPQDADIAKGKVSVLTPVGAALIGLGEGQTMTWTGRDGRAHALKVLKVG